MLFTRRSDAAAAVLLGIATFSKVTTAMLFVPMVLWHLWQVSRRRAIRATSILGTVAVFLLFAGGLFAINKLISGEWNYQGGDRHSYYVEFPFQNEIPKHDLGQTKSREDIVLPEIMFNPRTFTSNLAHNLEYFFIGRHTGLVAYFFPSIFAMVAFLLAPRQRPGWQWLVLASGLLQGLIFLISTPYTWHGGGVGNRYFFSGYAVMLFALPPIQSAGVAFAEWAIGSLFVAPMVLNPFVASFHPADNAKSGPLRMFPVELTLVNDLPVNTEPEHARLWFGDTGQGDPGFLVYFLDNNAFDREPDKSFWTRGRSRSEFIIKTDKPIRRATFTLTAGPVATDARVTIRGRGQAVHLAAGESHDLVFTMPPGVPYEKEVRHMVIARSLAQALRDDGHTADIVVTPQNRFGRQASAYIATWFTDVGSSDGAPIDRVISLRYPSYAVRHPKHVCWLNHTMREYYDLWDRFSATLSPRALLKERARRWAIHRADRYLLTRNVSRLFVQSRTIQRRLAMWPELRSTVLYPPAPQREYRCDGYGDYVFLVSRLTR
ncbi:MAG: hypothetical protein JF632_07110, partial [Acidobacteria bacterium]|nr:hypothetical protein [Acidobacteriota bacterium]